MKCCDTTRDNNSTRCNVYGKFVSNIRTNTKMLGPRMSETKKNINLRFDLLQCVQEGLIPWNFSMSLQILPGTCNLIMKYRYFRNVKLLYIRAQTSVFDLLVKECLLYKNSAPQVKMILVRVKNNHEYAFYAIHSFS